MAKTRRFKGGHKFGQPKSKKFAVKSKSGAKSTKAKATAAYKKGKINKTTRDRIHAKANRVIRRKK